MIATDASDEQIAAAISKPGVTYRVATAEDSRIDDASVNLITVGQALHWFHTERFFVEAKRVLVPGGVLAAWCYELCRVCDTCDLLVDRLYTDIVGDFWPAERALIEARYAPIEMPGAPIEAPRFEMKVEWTADEMVGYLGTWSACKRYQKQHGCDPVTLVETALREAWGNRPRVVVWPLTLLVRRFD